MNLEEYISSGIIDSYVLGSASPQERREVECMVNIYPELKTVLIDKQAVIEKVVIANSVMPPDYLKEKVFKAISKIEEEENKIIPIQKKYTSLLAIAAGIILFCFVYTSYIIFEKNNQLVNTEKELNSLRSKNKTVIKALSFYKDVNTNKIELSGTDKNPNLLINLLWNIETSTVLAYGNQLPNLPSEKDYQLWAIVDKVPVSLGILDKQEETELLFESEEFGNVEAFAVTIEVKGGSESPNLDELQVIGEV